MSTLEVGNGNIELGTKINKSNTDYNFIYTKNDRIDETLATGIKLTGTLPKLHGPFSDLL